MKVELEEEAGNKEAKRERRGVFKTETSDP